MPRLSKLAWLLIAVIPLLLAVVIWGWQSHARRSALRQRYREVLASGSSLYVNDSVCADCHESKAASHQQTGHAHTFHLSRESPAARWLNNKTFADPERSYQYHYFFDEQSGLSVMIPEQFGDRRFPLPYVLGSGHRALTFLTLIPDRVGDVVGIEHRVSLYSGGKKEDPWELDLTPGHKTKFPQQEVEHFGKVVKGDTLTLCVACHTTTAEITRQEITELRPHVGCQNCHGPGREHVAAVIQGKAAGYAELRKRSAKEEIQLCGRCHRLPNDSVDEVSPTDLRIVRFQSVGLLQSPCYQARPDELRCTTCHDPHQPVSHDASHYEQRCLSCHSSPTSTRCSVSPQSNCIECHMPAIDIHRGIEFHDHWIRVRSRTDDPRNGSGKEQE